MAICIVQNGVAHRECLSPSSSADAGAVVNWALSKITNQRRKSDANVRDFELRMLLTGHFKRLNGAVVTFGLPAIVVSAIGSLMEGMDWSPQFYVAESEREYIMNFDIPGVALRDLEVTVEGEAVLLISGERKIGIKGSTGPFRRTAPLPKGVDANAIRAKVDTGVLSIYLPKYTAQQAVARQVHRGEVPVTHAKAS